MAPPSDVLPVSYQRCGAAVRCLVAAGTLAATRGLAQGAGTVARPDLGDGWRRRIAVAVAIVVAVTVGGLVLELGDENEQVATDGSRRPVPYTGSLPEVPLPSEERHVLTDPDELEDLVGEQARAQAPLVAVADEIQRVVAEHELDGFAGIAINEEAGLVTLYWKDEPPDEIDSVIVQSAATVEIRPADYTETELLAEAERIARLGTTRSGAAILQVGPLDDYSGLMVVLGSDAAAERGDQEIESPVHLEFSTGEPAVAIAG
jgi:hypothetical protein